MIERFHLYHISYSFTFVNWLHLFRDQFGLVNPLFFRKLNPYPL